MVQLRFELMEPVTLQEASNLLSNYGTDAKIIAGGTDLLPQMKQKKICPKYLISLMKIPELNYIRLDGDLRIGGTTTIRDIEKSKLDQNMFHVLHDATDRFASIQIRNVATIGGNLCNGAPSADMATPLMVLGANVKIEGKNGEKIIPVEDFFLEPNKCFLTHADILAEITVPPPLPNSGGAYIKLMRRNAMDLPIVGVSVELALGPSLLVCSDIKVALTVVGPIPVRAKNVEAVIKGEKIEDNLMEKAARLLSEETNPRDSMRSTAEYRKEMIGMSFKLAIRKALERIKEASL
jgi:carbon-monoxide dehydrogenase medium subunit